MPIRQFLFFPLYFCFSLFSYSLAYLNLDKRRHIKIPHQGVIISQCRRSLYRDYLPLVSIETTCFKFIDSTDSRDRVRQTRELIRVRTMRTGKKIYEAGLRQYFSRLFCQNFSPQVQNRLQQRATFIAMSTKCHRFKMIKWCFKLVMNDCSLRTTDK